MSSVQALIAPVEVVTDGRYVVISQSAVLCLDNAGQVWRNSSPTWVPVPGLEGIQSLSASGGGTLWFTQGNPGEDNPIFFLVNDGADAVRTNGAALQVSSAPDGEVWARTKSSTLLRWNGETESWDPKTGALAEIAVAGAGLQWGLDGKNNILRRLQEEQDWTIVAAGPDDSTIESLTVSEQGFPCVVTSDGIAYMLVFDTLTWIPIGSPEVKIRSLTLRSFKQAWCITSDGDPLFAGTHDASNLSEIPFADEVVAEWDTESVFDETKSTHLYILNRAIQLASTLKPLGDFIRETMQPMARPEQSYLFRKSLCQGLYDADFRKEYNNPELFFPWPVPQPSYKSHFYDDSTGKNWWGDKDPTALTNGIKFFNQSIASMTRASPDLAQAGYSLGLALHYFTDLSQPMHAGNYTYLSSTPFGYHTDFEEYLLKIQARLSPQPKVTEFDYWEKDADWLYKSIAKQSRVVYLPAIKAAINYSLWKQVPEEWQRKVTPFLPTIMDIAVGWSAQLIYLWASLAQAIQIANGMQVRLASTGAVFVVMDNKLRGVPDMETYKNLFKDWDKVINIPSIERYPMGSSFSKGASIIGAKEDTPPQERKTYLHSNGMKRWIKNSDVFNVYGFTWDKLKKLTAAELKAIPDGPLIDR